MAEPGVPDLYDLAIVGGGINGCGIARDAAGRGLAVFLCEQDDLASGTSSRSTKLIHGGLRYLEQYAFRLVHAALREREVLWRIAPHIVHPLRFVLPYQAGLRPAWILRLGLLLYDHLGGRRRLPATRSIDLSTDAAGRPLRPGRFSVGFEYSDCWVDDARLVVLNARDAADHGAVIRTRARALVAERRATSWLLTTADATGRRLETIAARVLVNAAGPWVEQFDRDRLGLAPRKHVRMVQGSHIVVPALFAHQRAYIFQNPDGRIVFALPYEGEFTLLGTTDRDYHGDPTDVAATAEEIAYLCAAASANFARPVRGTDVVWSYSGVRPLIDDGARQAQAASRDYALDLDARPGAAALLSVLGGKITVYRRLAEEVLRRLERHLPPARQRAAGWTGEVPLPGGDFAAEEFATLAERLRERFPFLTEPQALRLLRAYGTRAPRVLGDARSRDALGRHFGAGLYEAEVAYLMDEEWARTAHDILWRRSKLGLHFDQAQAAALEAFMRARLPAAGRAPLTGDGGGPNDPGWGRTAHKRG
jgi:glycerol-3-phosphate dehydrogenase